MTTQKTKPETVDFAQLIKSSECGGLTLDFRSKLADRIKEAFTEEEQTWFIANFYVYLQYHPTRDFPIKLENVFSMIGFATKANAKRTLLNNFTEGEDYLLTVSPRDDGKFSEEEILLNVDTFKNLCMITKTEKSKRIRKYYIKLEGLFNNLMNEQRQEFEKKMELLEQSLEEKEHLLEKQKEVIEDLETRPETEGFGTREAGEFYAIIDRSKKPGFHIKFGIAWRSLTRIEQLNVASSTRSLELYAKFETFDRNFAERLIHMALQPFRIVNRKEWFYFHNDRQLAYAMDVVKRCLEFIENFDINDTCHFKELIQTFNPDDHLIKNENVHVEHFEKVQEKLSKINTQILQKAPARSGTFKGVFWDSRSELWCATLQNGHKRHCLGYFADEIDGAKVYNDYAMYLNQTEGTNFSLNDIPGYKTVPRNIPEIMRLEKVEKKSSSYRGVSYDSRRKHFVVGIQLTGKTYNLGSGQDPLELAKIYNQQALFFNETLKTEYPLNDIPGYTTIAKDIASELAEKAKTKKTSSYYGVSKTAHGKWACSYMMNRKKFHIGTFEKELEAVKAYNDVVIKLNEKGFNYKLNLTTLIHSHYDV